MTELPATIAPIASPATARAVALLASRRPDANALGRHLADQIADPEAFARELGTGLEALADEAYRAGQRRVAPGIGLIHGVRMPLLAAVAAGFRRASRRESAAALLFIADRLLREPHLEARWFAFGVLERTLPHDPERTWQLLRRAARGASDWITVDTLAHAYASGIAGERYRWAELEQLAYSSSRWERRLVGSTIATMTHGTAPRHDAAREPGAPKLGASKLAERGLALLGQVIGDVEPDVQKALAWAYRSLAAVDPEATLAALEREADLATATADGHRAWVIRDSLTKLAPAAAGDLRRRLAGVHRRPGAPGTAVAGLTADQFRTLPDPADHPEPPLFAARS